MFLVGWLSKLFTLRPQKHTAYFIGCTGSIFSCFYCLHAKVSLITQWESHPEIKMCYTLYSHSSTCQIVQLFLCMEHGSHHSNTDSSLEKVFQSYTCLLKVAMVFSLMTDIECISVFISTTKTQRLFEQKCFKEARVVGLEGRCSHTRLFWIM